MEHDYSKHLQPPTADQLAGLDALVEQVLDARQRGDKKAEHELVCWLIPEEMFLLHLDEHETASGIRVTLEESIRIPTIGEAKSELNEWLQANGHDDVLAAIRGPFKTKQQRRKAEAMELGALVSRLHESGGADDLLRILKIVQIEKARVSSAPRPSSG